MGEHYGTCRVCKGQGYFFRLLEEVDPVLLKRKTEKVECGICNGEGFSGDAMDFYEADNRREREEEAADVRRNDQ